MKVFIREELCTDKPINLRKLSPFMKVYAGILTWYRESNFYKRGEHKRLEQQHAAQVQRDETLKDILLALIYKELSQNSGLKDKDDVCVEAVFKIDAKYKDSLERILTHQDFILYDIKRIEENSDARIAFPMMPILISVKKKIIN